MMRDLKLWPVVAIAALAVTNSARAEMPAGWQQVGQASYYSSRYNGRPTASGARYDPAAMTAAHPWLPLGTRLRVLREDSGQSVVVTVNDRQAANGRVLDLSRGAAERLGMLQRGVARVRLIALSPVDEQLASGDQPAPLATAAPRRAPHHRAAPRHAAAARAPHRHHLHRVATTEPAPSVMIL